VAAHRPRARRYPIGAPPSSTTTPAIDALRSSSTTSPVRPSGPTAIARRFAEAPSATLRAPIS
jgi:hypothetical protein